MRCPTCYGAGQLEALVDGPNFSGLRLVTCSICKGTTEITTEHAERIERGRDMRLDRVAQRISLLEAARMRGITAAELSQIERGDGPAEAYK